MKAGNQGRPLREQLRCAGGQVFACQRRLERCTRQGLWLNGEVMQSRAGLPAGLPACLPRRTQTKKMRASAEAVFQNLKDVLGLRKNRAGIDRSRHANRSAPQR